MADYRLYFMDPAGHIRKAVEFECADEKAALNLAEEHRRKGRHAHGMELWQRTRLIHKFPPSGAPAKD